MRFMISWTLPHGEGFAVAETDDAKALFEWVAEWTEHMEIQACPAIEDTDAGAVMQSLYG